MYRKKQKENQEDLLKKVNDETLRQLTNKQGDGDGGDGGGRRVSEVVAYRSVKEIPLAREMAIQVPPPFPSPAGRRVQLYPLPFHEAEILKCHAVLGLAKPFYESKLCAFDGVTSTHACLLQPR